ncbi:hypothetical protein ALI22I_01470 [Saccharothrix sp. ALI-22-I]|uniref:WXG100 family type VII secretion target n=1 Tax=Saccharothrix sp. ALI-22-I TaxID=1933778 RepID=UPI00097C7E40|nr:WXG100 family type VII secretion target [Saccharothrix sp. ALI-22-I]ONI92874.1 hypothetical protein ALI22I_01470 [Saccharothrix sp. ALI-22-I]
MAGDRLDADVEILTGAAQKAQVVVTSVTATRDALRGPVSSMSGEWEGTANRAFVVAHGQWERDLQRVLDELDELGVGTGQSSNLIRQSDEDGQAAIANAAQHQPAFDRSTLRA